MGNCDKILTIIISRGVFTLVLKPRFSQSLSLHSHLSLAQAHLLEFGVWQSLAVVVLMSAAD